MTISESDPTPWYPTDVKPVRPGVYEVDVRILGYASMYAYWDGAKWGWRQHTVVAADRNRDTHGASQNKKWRDVKK